MKNLLLIIGLSAYLIGASAWPSDRTWEEETVFAWASDDDVNMAMERSKADVRQQCRDLGGSHYFPQVVSVTQGFATVEGYGGFVGCDTCWIVVSRAICGYFVYY